MQCLEPDQPGQLLLVGARTPAALAHTQLDHVRGLYAGWQDRESAAYPELQAAGAPGTLMLQQLQPSMIGRTERQPAALPTAVRQHDQQEYNADDLGHVLTCLLARRSHTPRLQTPSETWTTCCTLRLLGHQARTRTRRSQQQRQRWRRSRLLWTRWMSASGTSRTGSTRSSVRR